MTLHAFYSKKQTVSQFQNKFPHAKFDYFIRTLHDDEREKLYKKLKMLDKLSHYDALPNTKIHMISILRTTPTPIFGSCPIPTLKKSKKPEIAINSKLQTQFDQVWKQLHENVSVTKSDEKDVKKRKSNPKISRKHSRKKMTKNVKSNAIIYVTDGSSSAPSLISGQDSDSANTTDSEKTDITTISESKSKRKKTKKKKKKLDSSGDLKLSNWKLHSRILQCSLLRKYFYGEANLKSEQLPDIHQLSDDLVEAIETKQQRSRNKLKLKQKQIAERSKKKQKKKKKQQGSEDDEDDDDDDDDDDDEKNNMEMSDGEDKAGLEEKVDVEEIDLIQSDSEEAKRQKRDEMRQKMENAVKEYIEEGGDWFVIHENENDSEEAEEMQNVPFRTVFIKYKESTWKDNDEIKGHTLETLVSDIKEPSGNTNHILICLRLSSNKHSSKTMMDFGKLCKILKSMCVKNSYSSWTGTIVLFVDEGNSMKSYYIQQIRKCAESNDGKELQFKSLKIQHSQNEIIWTDVVFTEIQNQHKVGIKSILDIDDTEIFDQISNQYYNPSVVKYCVSNYYVVPDFDEYQEDEKFWFTMVNFLKGIVKRYVFLMLCVSLKYQSCFLLIVMKIKINCYVCW